MQMIIGCHAKILIRGSNVYPVLSEEEQCALYSSIGLVACASAHTLSLEPSSEIRGIKQMHCKFCDSDSKDSVIAVWEGPESEEAFTTIAKLVKLPRTQKYRRPRVAAMLALKRLLSHTSSTDYLSLSNSQFGQWCLQALHSSVRELRIAAG